MGQSPGIFSGQHEAGTGQNPSPPLERGGRSGGFLVFRPGARLSLFAGGSAAAGGPTHGSRKGDSYHRENQHGRGLDPNRVGCRNQQQPPDRANEEKRQYGDTNQQYLSNIPYHYQTLLGLSTFS